jgi:hypothetical protein
LRVANYQQDPLNGQLEANREKPMMDDEELSAKARRLAAVIEPFAGQVYFSPECHAEYAQLGFSPSPAERKGVALPDGSAYFCSRGSLLGQVPGDVVASAFAVFNPLVVVPAVTSGWSITDAATIEQARTDGAIAQLTRILGPEPAGIERVRDILGPVSTSLRVAGKPLYAGVLAQAVPSSPMGAAWRFADRLREYRGDAHTAAWTSAGFRHRVAGRRFRRCCQRARTDGKRDPGDARLSGLRAARDGEPVRRP